VFLRVFLDLRSYDAFVRTKVYLAIAPHQIWESLNMYDKAKEEQKSTRNKDVNLQVEKSQIARASILGSAVKCLLKYGYSGTTTPRIAEHAGLTRGAMVYHFGSRDEVIKATILYIQDLRRDEYKALVGQLVSGAGNNLDKEHVRRGINAVWEYHQLPSFLAYHELLVASRTDQKLNNILAPIEETFEKEFLELVRSMFPSFDNLDEALELATDVTFFTLQSMATSHMRVHRKKRVENILSFLVDKTIAIRQEAEKNKQKR
jgi:AcrR family transcriptional regulator